MHTEKEERDTIPTEQIKNLRQNAHHLKPTVLIGQKGKTEAVLKEVDTALTAHELIKMRIRMKDREKRQLITREIAAHSGATIVSEVGLMSTLYRPRKEESDKISRSQKHLTQKHCAKKNKNPIKYSQSFSKKKCKYDDF